MQLSISQFTAARDEVSANSAGGAPFLLCYGVTFTLTAILAFFLPRETSALLAMFQGALALPAALWLERRMGSARMSADNPLKQLSALMAMSQALALPFLIVIYTVNPSQIPVVMAGLGGVHFLPYAWLHRTRLYQLLAFGVSFGAFGLVLGLQQRAYPYVLLWVGLLYLLTAPLVYRHARRLTAAAA